MEYKTLEPTALERRSYDFQLPAELPANSSEKVRLSSARVRLITPVSAASLRQNTGEDSAESYGVVLLGACKATSLWKCGSVPSGSHIGSNLSIGTVTPFGVWSKRSTSRKA